MLNTVGNQKVLRYQNLVELIGEKASLALCIKYGGRLIPAAKRVLAEKRMAAMRYDFDNHGANAKDLSLKYQVTYNHAARMVAGWVKERRVNREAEVTKKYLSVV